MVVILIIIVILICKIWAVAKQNVKVNIIETESESEFKIEESETKSNNKIIEQSERGLSQKNNQKTKKTNKHSEKLKVSESEETEAERLPDAEKVLHNMSLEEKIAQMFVVTPDALTQVTNTIYPGEVTYECFTEIPVGGFVMMGNNITDKEQICTLNKGLKKISKECIGVFPFLCVDEEGGTVSRIASNKNFGIDDVGTMREVGASEDMQWAYQVGQYIGKYLFELGFNVDFAPDADVLVNENNTVIGSRSFGQNAEIAAGMVGREVEGLRSQKVCATLKHFPGHGSTGEDSHKGFAYSYRTMEQVEECELLPFWAGIEAGAEFVMTGHISLPNITENEIPSTLSPYIVTELLRENMGYEGIIITDAMNMGAIANHYSSGEAAIQAIEAGNDMILMPYDFRSAYYAVLDAVKTDRIPEERIDKSVQRILELKLKIEYGE